MDATVEELQFVEGSDGVLDTNHLLPPVESLAKNANRPSYEYQQTRRWFPFENQRLAAPEITYEGIPGKLGQFVFAEAAEQGGSTQSADTIKDSCRHVFYEDTAQSLTKTETGPAGDGPSNGERYQEDSMAETSLDVVKRYLQDAVAAEKSFETQLQGFAKEGDNPAAKALFNQHAIETRRQYEMLTARLEALGGSPSATKSLLAHIFGLSPKTAQIGHEEEERTTQNLMMAFAVENSEVAMYEALIAVSEAAGDTQTATLARQIQGEEKATADKVWKLIPTAALEAYTRLTGRAAAATASSTRAV
jgi:ferritin-like metal-binding protein YciE